MWDSLADINKVDWARGRLRRRRTRPRRYRRRRGDGRRAASTPCSQAAARSPTSQVERSPELVQQGGQPAEAAGRRPGGDGRGAGARQGADGRGDDRPPARGQQSDQVRALARAGAGAAAEPARARLHGGRPGGRGRLSSTSSRTRWRPCGRFRARCARRSTASRPARSAAAPRISGLLARILPALRDAALWRNYEREYRGGEERVRRGLHGGLREGVPQGL